MQAQTAKNETRLPRAVLRMSRSLDEQIAAREPKPDPTALLPEGEAPQVVAPEAVAVTPVDTESTPAVDPRESDPAYWKQRFKVTQGVLAAERTERKTAEYRANQRMTELQGQIAQLQATAPAAPTDLGKYFSPEEVEDIGEEECHARVKMIEKAVKDQLAGVIEKEVQPLRDQREAQQADALRDRKEAFLDKLTELVPEYSDLDTPESGFHAWLAEENDDGVTRQEVLNKHVSAFNAPRVAKVFQDFLKTTSKVAVQPPVAPRGTGAGGAPQFATANGKGAPTPAEMKDYFKRASVVKRGQPGYVTDQERAEFEGRMRLRAG